LKNVEYKEEDFFVFFIRKTAKSPFEVLVAIILSQNTSDKNAARAYSNLKKAVGEITPQTLRSLSREELEKAIEPAGMHRIRAQRLRELAEFFDDAHFDVKNVDLTKIPGIGKKTVDVLLINYGIPTFPVDTHIMRIANRWGIGRKYEEIKKWFVENLPENRLFETHLKLIQFGRTICKAKNPKCRICPVKNLCPWPNKKVM